MDYRSHPDQTIWFDLDEVADTTIDSEKTVLANFTITGNNYVRRDKNMIVYQRLMPYMIAAPENDIVADANFVLQDVVLHDEAVLTNLHVVPDKRPGTYIRNTLVSF